MRRRLPFAAPLAPALVVGALAAAGPQEPPPPPAMVVRVTVGLVQVDAVVTDKQGRHVTDLAPADFVIKEGGQEREITHLSYVRLVPAPVSGAKDPEPGAGTEAAPSAGGES